MIRKLRIAVWHNLPSGGGKRALHDHVRGLASRGHTLEFFAPDGPERDYLPLRNYGKEHIYQSVDLSPKTWFLRGVRETARTMSAQHSAILRHCKEVGHDIDSGNFDVVFANSCLISAAPAVGRFCKTPAVLYLQEPNRSLYEAGFQPAFAIPAPGRSKLAPWFVRQWLKDWFETPIRRWMIREEFESAKSYKAILVNSCFSRESVLRAYGLNAEVCYLGVDSLMFQPVENPARDYLVGLGAFIHNKNIPFVIHAIALLPTPRPRLVWIGNTIKPAHYLNELKKLAQEKGVDLDPRLQISQQDLVGLVGGALAMVYAPRLEPFGYAPLEANACGIPVIAVAEGGVRETVQDGINGLLVKAYPRAMSDAIARLQSDPALALQLGDTGRQIVNSAWTVDAAIERLESALLANAVKVN